jgi:hypothetical protein
MEMNTNVATQRLILKSKQVAVFDNFLSPEDHFQILEHCNHAQYTPVHAHQWRKVWRLRDGHPLQGSTVTHRPDSSALAAPTEPWAPFIRRLDEVLPTVTDVVGGPDTWVDVTIAPWIYPAGSGLSLHLDGMPHFAGSYTYFLHKNWNIHWGGLLLILDPETALGSNRATGEHWIYDDEETLAALDPGTALCIFPKPNRIVFVAPNAHHLITRVDQSAGQNPRISIAGFFRRMND